MEPGADRAHQRRIAAGKNALIVCARTLLGFAVAVMQRGTPWQDPAAAG